MPFVLHEPIPTAALLTVFGLLLAVSVLFSRAMERLGVPVVLLFLTLGMLAGSEGIAKIPFDDYALAFRLGTLALVLILFDGGLNTSLRAVKRGLAPAGVLATLGVAMTAGLVALAARGLGRSWDESMLLGAVVSSTDAATVFAVLRGGGLRLKERVGTTLELESGLNDPMAVILTVTLTHHLAGGGAPLGWSLLWSVPLQLVIGTAVGIGAGLGGRWALARARLAVGGLYPALTVALALLAFGFATLVEGSGFLAVYAAGVVLGNGPLPYRNGLTQTHDAVAWMSQITMFLMLGLLVFPSQLPAVAGTGLAIGLFLAFVARPLAAIVCLAPFRFPAKEVGYLGWVGLRGAVPIILGTFPVMANVPGAHEIFNIVFFVVVVNAIVPGSTIVRLTRWLGLETSAAPPPAAALEVNSTRILKGDLMSFYIEPPLAVCDAALSQVHFPEGSAAVLLVRGTELMACRGDTVMKAGDHVYVFCRPEDRPFIQLLFGRPQQGG